MSNRACKKVEEIRDLDVINQSRKLETRLEFSHLRTTGIINSHNLDNISRHISCRLKAAGKEKATLLTGVTTSYRVANNQLREFIIADKLRQSLKSEGVPCEVILINDNLDPLTERHLKLMRKSDPDLNLSDYLGVPISRIPCPYGCHDNLSQHFNERFLSSLEMLGIYPRVEFSDKLYSDKHDSSIRKILGSYDAIRDLLCKKFGLNYPQGLFKVICSHCGKMTHTKIQSIVESRINYICKNCGHEGVASTNQGKFTWKIDCALRWASMDADFEPFLTNYLSKPSGSYIVSHEISKDFLGINPPFTVGVEYLRYSHEISDLFNVLPKEAAMELIFERFDRSKIIAHSSVLAEAKAYKYPSGKSFLQASFVIGSMRYPDYGPPDLEAINKAVFGFPEASAEDWAPKATCHLDMALKFFDKFVPQDKRSCLLPPVDIQLPEDKAVLVNMLKYLEENGPPSDGNSKDPGMGKQIYRALFGKEFGPSLGTVFMLMPGKYRHYLSEQIHERL